MNFRPFGSRTYFFLALCVCLVPSRGWTREYKVSNASQISSLLGLLAPGDTVTMSAGTWTNQKIVFSAAGTADKPVLLRSESYGSVILNGTSTLRIGGTYVVVDGLLFKGGASVADAAVIDFRNAQSVPAAWCRLTRTTIVDYNPPSIDTDYKWVSLYGDHNRVDHCSFENKTHSGTTLVVWLAAQPNYHQIDHNYFGPRPALGFNGGETIRVGTSDWSMYDSYTTVENNYFDRCNGEIEVISNKSCGNVYRGNVFSSCEGTLTLRHGNRCSVYNNYFFCNKAPNSGGVRIIGEDHKVYNNYIERSDGNSLKCGITIMNGVPNSPLNRYFQVKRAVVAFNTIVDTRCPINIGAGKDSELSLPPVDCVIANNIVRSTTAPLVTYTDTPVNITYEGNIFYGATLGILKPAGISQSNPNLVLGADSLWRLGASSPAINAASGTYPFVTTDFDGQARTGVLDAGADEYSTDPVLIRPIRKADTGPQAAVTSVRERVKGGLPASFGLLQNYPNPFNPVTTIAYSLASEARATLALFTAEGKHVKTLVDEVKQPGTYSIVWNASDVPSGVYFCRLEAGLSTSVKRLTLIK